MSTNGSKSKRAAWNAAIKATAWRLSSIPARTAAIIELVDEPLLPNRPVCVGIEPSVALGIQVRTPAAILGNTVLYIHLSCAERAAGRQGDGSVKSKRQSADSVQPGQLVEAQHLTHFGHLACWRLAPSAETIAH